MDAKVTSLLKRAGRTLKFCSGSFVQYLTVPKSVPTQLVEQNKIWYIPISCLGLAEMPSGYFTQVQLAIWPEEKPAETFLQCAWLLQYLATTCWYAGISIKWCDYKDPLTEEKAEIIVANYESGGTAKVLYTFFWSWKKQCHSTRTMRHLFIVNSFAFGLIHGSDSLW